MSYIFIEFEISDNIKGYCIDFIEDEFIKYLPRHEYLDSRYNGSTIKINTIKKITDLSIYQQTFGFKDQKFCSIKDYDIFSILKTKILKTSVGALLDTIFDLYLKIDPEFYISQEGYDIICNIIDKNLKELETFKTFLSEWKGYLEYREHLIKFNPISGWDSNLTDIIDQYINPNYYQKIADRCFVFSNTYIAEYLYRAGALMEINRVDPVNSLNQEHNPEDFDTGKNGSKNLDTLKNVCNKILSFIDRNNLGDKTIYVSYFVL